MQKTLKMENCHLDGQSHITYIISLMLKTGKVFILHDGKGTTTPICVL
jgi:hypothetical protein